MTFVTQAMLLARKEKDCFAITHERKFYHQGNSFVKRSLRPSEWQVSHFKGTVCVPRQGNERLWNEAAGMRFVAEKTNVPVPKLYCAFEDDGAVYLVMEYIEGVGMNELTDEEKETVKRELEGHLTTLHKLRSQHAGGSLGLVMPPYRAMRKTYRDNYTLKPAETEEFVFCHNDLSQHNVIVNPTTLKINAIIDWEYAGFYPEYFEGHFFERLGPSVAQGGEEDDSDKLVEFLNSRMVCLQSRCGLPLSNQKIN